MGFRFRKTISLLPGVRLNVSKSGISASVGGKGATVNIGKGGRLRGTVGLPGSGMSYSESVTPGQTGRTVYIILLIVGLAVAYGLYRWLH